LGEGIPFFFSKKVSHAIFQPAKKRVEESLWQLNASSAPSKATAERIPTTYQ